MWTPGITHTLKKPGKDVLKILVCHSSRTSSSEKGHINPFAEEIS